MASDLMCPCAPRAGWEVTLHSNTSHMEVRACVSDSIQTNRLPHLILWGLWYIHSSSSISYWTYPPNPHPHTPRLSLLCLSACLTCVNPSQAARRSVHSRWFMAAEAWLHRRERSGEQTGDSICLVRGWLSRHPAGGRESEGEEKAQPETLGPSPRDLAGKTATEVMVVALAVESKAGNRSNSTCDLQVFASAVKSCLHLELKLPSTETWGLGASSKRIQIWLTSGCSPPLASNRRFPAIQIRKIGIMEWNICLWWQEFIILHLPGWVNQRSRQLITPDLHCWSPEPDLNVFTGVLNF